MTQMPTYTMQISNDESVFLGMLKGHLTSEDVDGQLRLDEAAVTSMAQSLTASEDEAARLVRAARMAMDTYNSRTGSVLDAGEAVPVGIP